MEFWLATAFLGGYLWGCFFKFLFVLLLVYILRWYIRVTFLGVWMTCLGLKAFFLAPKYHTLLFINALCHFSKELRQNTYLSNHCKPEKVLARVEKEQKKMDRGTENNVWEGEVSPEGHGRKSNVERTLEDFHAKNKINHGTVESVVQPNSSISKCKGKNRRNKKSA